ncbi:MAG: sarcosine oxidase subunit beta [Planctomycetota bacterium]
MKAKTLIVGGGVMGAAIAYYVAQRSDPLRAPVVLVDKGEVGKGSSNRSGAILRNLYANRGIAQMARESMREYASFEARTGRGIGYRRSGVMTMASSDQHEVVERMRTMFSMLDEMGVGVEWVEAPRIRHLVRDVKVADNTVGIWEREGGTLDPLRTVEAFTALARTYGAVTRVGSALKEIKVENGKVVGAITDEGLIETERIVLAAGPWTAGILAPMGIELPLRVVRPETVFFQLAESALPLEEEKEEDLVGQRPNLGFDMSEGDKEMDELGLGDLSGDQHPVVIDLEFGFFARCELSRGRTRVGRIDYQTDELVTNPDQLKEEISRDSVSWAREALTKRLPEYSETEEAGGEAAMYTLTPDAHALIGPVTGVEGLFVVAGFSGHGFKLGPSIGLGVAQMLDGERVTAFDSEFFSPSRFDGKDLTWGGQFGL